MLGRITATALLMVQGVEAVDGTMLERWPHWRQRSLFALAAGVAVVGGSVPDDDRAGGLRLSDT